jgi:hypothetical protein
MYPRRHHPDVQDLGFELLDYGVQSKRAVPRRNQVWRLPDHDHWNAHVRLFPVYLSGQGEDIGTYPQRYHC